VKEERKEDRRGVKEGRKEEALWHKGAREDNEHNGQRRK